MSKRAPLSKSLRFEIFRRDGFTCRYCGRRPPEVVLEIDHVVPVAEGGTNEHLNLVTSCVDCNRGKAAKVLSDPVAQPDADIERLALAQDLAEIRSYQNVRCQLDEALEEAVLQLEELWYDSFDGRYCPVEELRKWVRQYGVEAVDYGITHSAWKRNELSNNRSRCSYVGAVIRNRAAWEAGRSCETCRHSFESETGSGESCLGCMQKPSDTPNRYLIVRPNQTCKKWAALEDGNDG